MVPCDCYPCGLRFTSWLVLMSTFLAAVTHMKTWMPCSAISGHTLSETKSYGLRVHSSNVCVNFSMMLKPGPLNPCALSNCSRATKTGPFIVICSRFCLSFFFENVTSGWVLGIIMTWYDTTLILNCHPAVPWFRTNWLSYYFEHAKLTGIGGPGAPHVVRLERIGTSGVHAMVQSLNIFQYLSSWVVIYTLNYYHLV